ncbi:FAD dependent oxidoreductase [Thozetella sp. PMI_491]|nr:FAD dependent oxidoreductase [Thozetella sp. PMI_491]
MSSTVILGAGIIGVSTAYYLSDHQTPSSIHLVEPAPELFSSASGHAGGFLAKDWFSPASAALGALSYEEHKRLAREHGGREKWGFSFTTSISYTTAQNAGSTKKGQDWLLEGTSRAGAAPAISDPLVENAPEWLRRVSGDSVELICADDSTAQLDPRQLCSFLLDQCRSRGVQIHHPANAISVSTDVRGELASLRVADTQTSTETDIPCQRVVLAAGSWSPRVFRSLFRHSNLDLPIASLAGHSLVLRSPRWHQAVEASGCHALYTTVGAHSPEIYGRLGGELFIGGANSSTIPLPEVAGEQRVEHEPIKYLRETALALLGPDGADDDLQVVREALCFRPVTPWGLPIIARIPDDHLGAGMATRPGADGGVFLAAGHGPWGITMSLGTGLVLAELIQGRPLSADISSLDLRL